jgi:hypothetical protein
MLAHVRPVVGDEHDASVRKLAPIPEQVEHILQGVVDVGQVPELGLVVGFQPVHLVLGEARSVLYVGGLVRDVLFVDQRLRGVFCAAQLDAKERGTWRKPTPARY